MGGQHLLQPQRAGRAGEQIEPQGKIMPAGQIGHGHLAQLRGVIHCRQAANHVAPQEPGPAHMPRHRHLPHHASGRDPRKPGIAEGRACGLHEGDLAGKLFGVPGIIGIQKGHVAPARRGQPGVARGRRPAPVAVLQEPHPPIARTQRPGAGGGGIG